MIALSTCLRSPTIDKGEELIRYFLDLGISHLELEYRISQKMFKEMKPLLKEVTITSIHNFFPVPDILPPDKEGSAEVFSLSSLDKEEREKAIAYTTRTIEVANSLEAKAVVVHLGGVEIKPETKRFVQLLKEGKIKSEEGRSFIRKKKEERKKKKGPHLDSACFSLEKLAKVAEREGVMIGIENGYKINKIPDPEELALLFSKFEGAPIYFWYDVGHAKFQDNIGFIDYIKLLTRFRKKLIGIHLHDIVEDNDHLPPGKGEIDFALIGKLLPQGVIKVMELQHKVNDEEALAGLNYLKEMGII
ncbi:MAG: sugar phosphate isomerase/epimerase [Acidobacteria bacterium]|nr:sugar phosphate isomerase/epimerase [Acidobacteriota bacterium]